MNSTELCASLSFSYRFYVFFFVQIHCSDGERDRPKRRETDERNNDEIRLRWIEFRSVWCGFECERLNERRCAHAPIHNRYRTHDSHNSVSSSSQESWMCPVIMCGIWGEKKDKINESNVLIFLSSLVRVVHSAHAKIRSLLFIAQSILEKHVAQWYYYTSLSLFPHSSFIGCRFTNSCTVLLCRVNGVRKTINVVGAQPNLANEFCNVSMFLFVAIVSTWNAFASRTHRTLCANKHQSLNCKETNWELRNQRQFNH